MINSKTSRVKVLSKTISLSFKCPFTTMATKYNVNVNFSGVFNQLNNKEDLRGVANEIIAQLEAAYKARLAKLMGKNEPTAISVAISTPTTAKTEPEQPKAEKKATTTKTVAKKATTDKATAKAEPKKADKKAKAEIKQVLISDLSKADIKAMGVKFVQYSEKCVALSGNTKAIKDDIKRLAGGHWNHARQCWFLKNDAGHKLAKAMGVKVSKVA